MAGFGMTVSELIDRGGSQHQYGHGRDEQQVLGRGKSLSTRLFQWTLYWCGCVFPPLIKLAELYGAAGFRADRLDDVGPAIEAALACGKPAVVDVSVDPSALYSFRRDSFKHRGG